MNFSTAGNLVVGSNCSIGGVTTLNGPLTSSSSITASLGLVTSTINASNNIVQSAGSISSGSGGIDSNGVLNVLGNTILSSDLTTNGNINLNANIIANGINISPIEMSYLDGGTQNLNTAITTIQTKVTDLSHSGTTNTMANNFVVNGTTTTTGNILLNGNIIANALTITPTELSALDNISGNIQSAISTANTNITNNTTSINTSNTNIATLQTQCTDLVHTSSTLDTFSQNLAVTNNLTAGSITSNGLITANNGLSVTGSTTFSDVNITGLGTFPTSNTGSTTGLSTYYNKASTNEVDFLSRAGTSTNGGFNLYTSNSTTAPSLLASVNKTGKITATSSLLNNSNGIALETYGESRLSGTLKLLAPSSNSYPKLSMLDFSGSTTLATLYTSSDALNMDVSNTLPNGLILLSSGTNLLKVDKYGHTTLSAGITSQTLKTYENIMLSSSQTKNINGLVGTWNVSQHYTKTINVVCPISIRLVTNNSTGNNSIFYAILSSCSYIVNKNGLPFSYGDATSSTTLPKSVYFSSSVNGSNSHSFLTTLGLSFTCSDDDLPATYTVSVTFSKSAFVTSVSDIYVNTDVSTIQLGTNTSLYNSSTAGINYANPSYSSVVNALDTVIGSTEVNDFFTNGEMHTMGSLTTHGSTKMSGDLQTYGDVNFAGQGNFPTTPTYGTSGLSVYWNKTGGGGEVDLLARGQGGSGGYSFYVSNTNTAPTLVASISPAGLITSNSLSTGKMYYNGIVGAYLIDGGINSQHYPIFNSIPDFTNFYSRSGSNSGLTVSVGTILTSSYSRDNIDDVYLVMPNCRLICYPNSNYGGTAILDMNNTGTVPVYVIPTSANSTTSCKLFCNNAEIA